MAKKKEELVQAPRVDAFLKEIDEVCQKHGFSLSHEDTQGGFIVEKYHRDFVEWLQQAAIGHTVRNANT